MPAKNRTTKPAVGEQPVRFAIYARYSTNMQSDVSLESQEMMCRRAVAERGGVVAKVYTDAAVIGWTLDREGFTQMRDDASKKRFDAVMMWKFDRLARDHTHVTMIKTLFRREYGVKLYCVEGFSEDDDDSPYTAMMEQMMGVIASFYSRNLSSEVKRGLIYRHEQGMFNGSHAPLGYILSTEKEPKHHRAVKATDSLPPGLHIVPREAAIVRRAFRMYATGEYGYREIAEYLNSKAKYLNLGGAVIGVSWVREMLLNRLYIGEVSHADVIYKDGFRKGRKNSRNRRSWRAGIHKAIITPELFDACQHARTKRGPGRRTKSERNPYLLSGKLWCGFCLEKSSSFTDRNYGKMHCYVGGKDRNDRRYQCISHLRGYERCGQKSVKAAVLEAQVIEALLKLSSSIPPDVEKAVNMAMRQRAERVAIMDRMEQLQDVIRRVDVSWENGFMSEEEYLKKRRDLQAQIDALTPIDYEALKERAMTLKSFADRWAEAKDNEERRRLVDGVVKAVVVRGKSVTRIVLHGDVPLLLSEDKMGTAGLDTQKLQLLSEKQANWLKAA
jgi:DNA invertase Pin-like site-specific DNA recombinase